MPHRRFTWNLKRSIFFQSDLSTQLERIIVTEFGKVEASLAFNAVTFSSLVKTRVSVRSRRALLTMHALLHNYQTYSRTMRSLLCH
jgi:hypothetical protein